MAEDTEDVEEVQLGREVAVREERGAAAPYPYANGVSREVHPFDNTGIPALKSKPRGLKIPVQARPGASGNVQYIDWVTAAKVLDAVFGPGNWYQKVINVGEWERLRPGSTTDMITEITVQTELYAKGLYGPVTSFGHHNFEWKNPNGSKSDAIESAMSKALTKSVARVGDYVRGIWSKQFKDETIASISPPDAGQINGVIMLLTSIKNMGRIEEAAKYLIDQYGIIIDSNNLESTRDSLIDVSRQVAIQISKDIVKFTEEKEEKEGKE